jgi:hypothetical protein
MDVDVNDYLTHLLYKIIIQTMGGCYEEFKILIVTIFLCGMVNAQSDTFIEEHVMDFTHFNHIETL